MHLTVADFRALPIETSRAEVYVYSSIQAPKNLLVVNSSCRVSLVQGLIRLAWLTFVLAIIGFAQYAVNSSSFAVRHIAMSVAPITLGGFDCEIYVHLQNSNTFEGSSFSRGVGFYFGLVIVIMSFFAVLSAVKARRYIYGSVVAASQANPGRNAVVLLQAFW
jgi:hypothetical protein